MASSQYATVDEFVSDVRLVFTNCIQYWGERGQYSISARYLLHEVDLSVKELRFALTTGLATEAVGGKKGTKGGHHAKGAAAHAAVLKPWTPALQQHLAGSGRDTPLTPSTPITPSSSLPSTSEGAAEAGAERAVLSPTEHRKCVAIVAALKANAAHELFAPPPDIPLLYVQLSDYYTRIARPMDLSTLARRLAVFDFASSEEFRAEAALMWLNVYAYYGAGGGSSSGLADADFIIQAARRLEADFNRRWDTFEQKQRSAAPPPPPPSVSPERAPLLLPSTSNVAAAAQSASSASPVGATPSAAPAPPTRLVIKMKKADVSGVVLLQPQEPAVRVKVEVNTNSAQQPHADHAASEAGLHPPHPTSASPAKEAASTSTAEASMDGRRLLKKEAGSAPSFDSALSAPPVAGAGAPRGLRLGAGSSQAGAAQPMSSSTGSAGSRSAAPASPARPSQPPNARTAAASAAGSALSALLPAPPKRTRDPFVVKPLTPSQRLALVTDARARLTACAPPRPTLKRPRTPFGDGSATDAAAGRPALPGSEDREARPSAVRERPPRTLPSPLSPPFQRAQLRALGAASVGWRLRASASSGDERSGRTPLQRSPGEGAVVSLEIAAPTPTQLALLFSSLSAAARAELYSGLGFTAVDEAECWCRAAHALLPATAFFPYHVDAFTIDLAGSGRTPSAVPQSSFPLSLSCTLSARTGDAQVLMPATARLWEEAAVRVLARRRAQGVEGAIEGAEADGAVYGAEGVKGAASVWPRLPSRPVRASDVAHLRRLPARLAKLSAAQLGERLRDAEVDAQRLLEPSDAAWTDGTAERSALALYNDLVRAQRTRELRWEEPGLWWAHSAEWEQPSADARSAVDRSHGRGEGPRPFLRRRIGDGPPALSAAARVAPFVRVRLFCFAGLCDVRLVRGECSALLVPSPTAVDGLIAQSVLRAWEESRMRGAREQQQLMQDERQRAVHVLEEEWRGAAQQHGAADRFHGVRNHAVERDDSKC